MAKKVQLMTNAKEWQTVDGVEVLVDVPQEDLDPITDSSCVEIEGHRTLEETISQDNMFTPEIVETKVHSKVGGVYHDNVVDGAYEEAILYGNTQVNLVESETTGTKYIPNSFTSFQGNESKIGNYHNGRTNQVAPLVKGVTMVNLCQKTSVTIAEGRNGGAIENIKSNTEYTLALDFTVQNTQKGFSIQSFKDDTYLETSMIRIGMGEKVEFTFTTHGEANRIYIVNNSGYGGEIQLDNIMVIEGDITELDLPFFKGMRSVELSRPLTNLFTDDLQIYNSGVTSTISNGNITVTSTGIATWTALNVYFKNLLKPHTQYLVMWDSLLYTHTGSTLATIAVYDNNGKGISEINKPSTQCPTLRSLVFDTKDYDVNYIKLRIHATTTNSETGTTTVKGLRVFEWDDSLRSVDLQSLGYFSGTKYVSVRALETEGKNLYPYGDVNFTSAGSNWYDAKGNINMYGDVASKSKSRFLLKKGTYTLSIGSTQNIEQYGLVDDKETTYGNTFTLSQDTYMTLRFKRIQEGTLTTVTNIQIERGETATTYEVYHSRYYKPRETEEIILRSLPNGVCDTFNLQTGELVQNIGEIVLDGVTGVQDWQLDGTNETTGISGFYLANSVTTYNFSIQKNEQYVISDKFKTISFEEWKNRDTEACVDNTGNIAFLISNSKLSEISGDGFKQYLQQNPITVQYKLKEPIITKLQTYDRIYNSQGLVSMGNNLSALTYNSSNYYLKVGNLSPIPGIIEPITSIPYNVRLKPSTLYTIKYNRGGHSNSMKFDLGGSVVEKTNSITDLTGIAEELTVRTPAILSHEQLILSGTGYAHNFIVVEGDITGTELPFFEGMKDVKMPIVKNIGRNLLDESTMTIAYQDNITLRYYKAFACKPNTTYHFKANKGETQCNWYSSTDPNVHIGMENITYLRYSGTIKTPANCKYLVIYTGGEPNTDPYSIKSAVYEDGSSLSYESHKENSVYAVQSEYPITSEMIEQGGFGFVLGDNYQGMKNDNTARLRSKDLIPVKPNTTYAFAHSFSKFAYNVYQWNGNKEFMDGTAQYFGSGQVETITTTADTQYINFLMSKHDASQTIAVAEYDWNNFHMYELDSTINLRSLPNGVKDELNLLTGEYIQRVGEIVLNGSEDWFILNDTKINTLYLYTPKQTTFVGISVKSRSLINDKFRYYSYETKPGAMTDIDSEMIIEADNEMYFFIEKNRLISNDLSGVTAYLQQNPVKVHYELAEPIISHVRLVSNNQEREVGVKLPNGVCNTYNPSTGITTVRVGKIVLDGRQTMSNHNQANWINDSVYGVKIKPPTDIALMTETSYGSGVYNMFTDSLPMIWSKGNFGANKEGIGLYNADKIFYMSISRTKLQTQDLEGVKSYLASNPITVYYELANPIVTTDIVLPNGVHDEYNPETGVYTKKVGFVELDGSEDWYAGIESGELQQAANGAIDMYGAWTTQPLPNVRPASDAEYKIPGVCDTFSFKNAALGATNEEFYFISTSGRFNINIARKKLTGSNVSHLKTYLSQNPIKLWYELQTPITYKLTPYFGLPQPYAYEDGYLIHDSAYPETTLPPEFKYKLVANRTGQVMQNNRKLQEHTTRLSNLEAIIIEATIESLFNRELQLFELELMDIQLIDLGE